MTYRSYTMETKYKPITSEHLQIPPKIELHTETTA